MGAVCPVGAVDRSAVVAGVAGGCVPDAAGDGDNVVGTFGGVGAFGRPAVAASIVERFTGGAGVDVVGVPVVAVVGVAEVVSLEDFEAGGWLRRATGKPS